MRSYPIIIESTGGFSGYALICRVRGNSADPAGSAPFRDPSEFLDWADRCWRELHRPMKMMPPRWGSRVDLWLMGSTKIALLRSWVRAVGRRMR